MEKATDGGQPGREAVEGEGDMGMYTQRKTKIERDRHLKGTERETNRDRETVKMWRNRKRWQGQKNIEINT